MRKPSAKKINAYREAGRAVAAYNRNRDFPNASVDGSLLRLIDSDRSPEDENELHDLFIRCAGVAAEWILTKKRPVDGCEDEQGYVVAFYRVSPKPDPYRGDGTNHNNRAAITADFRNQVENAKHFLWQYRGPSKGWKAVQKVAAELMKRTGLPYARVVEICDLAGVEREPLLEPKPQG
jgi:hypothetical protein